MPIVLLAEEISNRYHAQLAFQEVAPFTWRWSSKHTAVIAELAVAVALAISSGLLIYDTVR